MRYRHTQVATVPRLIVAAFAIVALGVGVQVTMGPGRVILVGVGIMLVVIAVLFTSLTTIVTADTLEHYHGPRFWRISTPLSHVASCEAVRNRWWYGFGIRLTPHGWLYNVWGLDAVEIRLADGRRYRIGTDDPRGLVEAITASRPSDPR